MPRACRVAALFAIASALTATDFAVVTTAAVVIATARYMQTTRIPTVIAPAATCAAAVALPASSQLPTWLSALAGSAGAKHVMPGAVTVICDRPGGTLPNAMIPSLPVEAAVGSSWPEPLS